MNKVTGAVPAVRNAASCTDSCQLYGAYGGGDMVTTRSTAGRYPGGPAPGIGEITASPALPRMLHVMPRVVNLLGRQPELARLSGMLTKMGVPVALSAPGVGRQRGSKISLESFQESPFGLLNRVQRSADEL